MATSTENTIALRKSLVVTLNRENSNIQRLKDQLEEFIQQTRELFQIMISKCEDGRVEDSRFERDELDYIRDNCGIVMQDGETVRSFYDRVKNYQKVLKGRTDFTRAEIYKKLDEIMPTAVQIIQMSGFNIVGNRIEGNRFQGYPTSVSTYGPEYKPDFISVALDIHHRLVIMDE